MYDPTPARFLSEDPLGFAGGDTNLYRYVGNSPTNFIDPFGLFTVEIRYRGAPFNVANHADIVVTDDDGSVTAYWARAKNIGIHNIFSPIFQPYFGSEGFGNIVADRSRENEYQPEFIFYVDDPNRIQVLYDNDDPCLEAWHDELERNIEQGFKNIQAAGIPYSPFTTNSNSAAFQVIRDIGLVNNLQPIPGVNPVGWDVNPYTYWQSLPKPNPQPGPKPLPAP